MIWTIFLVLLSLTPASAPNIIEVCWVPLSSQVLCDVWRDHARQIFPENIHDVGLCLFEGFNLNTKLVLLQFVFELFDYAWINMG